MMIQSFKRLSCIMVAAIASTMLADVANAEPRFRNYPTGYQPFAEDFMRAATRTSGEIFRTQSLRGQLSTFLGVGLPWPGSINAFPETLITNDAKLLNEVYRQAIIDQVATDPIIRTPDLPNPYNTSILTQPSYSDLNLQTPPSLPIGNR